MSARSVALVDNDNNLATHLQGELGRYGFAVEPLGNADELMARQAELPDVIVLCIDPKRTGWAVCNRLRKSANVKGIPLIVTSAEATEKDFEDHKKLKTRAEDYLHKPFAADALVQKIADLVGMPEAQPEVIDIAVEADEEIQVEEDGLLVEDNGGTGRFSSPGFDGGAIAGGGFDVDERTRVAPLNLDDETDNAFAALGADAPEPTPVRAAPPHHDDPFAFKDSPFDVEEHESGTAPGAEPLVDALDLGLDAVAQQASARPRRGSSPQLVATPHHESSAADAIALAELRAERDKLAREVEELKARPAPAPTHSKAEGFSREREFLNLREVINKKEKEVLDLRDALDAKDRAILDGKDKIRELERRTRDFDEKLLHAERDMVAANEKLEAASGEQETSVQREVQLKSRIEDALKQLSRYEQDIEGWKQRHAADADTHAAELRALIDRAQNEKQIATESAANERAQLESDHARALESLRAQHEGALGNAADRHTEEVNATKQQHSDELAGVRSRAVQDLKAAQAAHEEALAQRETELRGELAALANRHEDALKAREMAAGAEAERLRGEHAAAVEEIHESHRDALGKLAEEHAAKLADELRAQHESHSNKLVALEESHADVKAGMQARHQATLSELEGNLRERDTQLAALTAQVAELQSAVTAAHEATAAAQAQAQAARSEVEARDAAVAERNTRISELEQESSAFQDQILKAYQRIKSDETTVQRAKKALAIALTLLDEHDGDEAKT